MFQKCEYVYKTACLHKSSYTPAKISGEKTINMAFVSSHIDLQNHVSDFWHVRLLFFYYKIKLEKRKNRTACGKKS